jgi:phytoene synthase
MLSHDVGQDYAVNLRTSQSYCRDLTRRQARNFYWGFVALPKEQRTAIYALYGFARQVDDDADLPGVPRGPDRFAYHRERLRRCFDGQASDPVMHALAHAIDRYSIPREDLEALICGVERDLQLSRYGTWEDLEAYCLLVASSVGRMCVRVFGFRDPVAFQLADDLGVAMQLANILRDMREDGRLGRVYLPQEDLRRFGVEEQLLLSGEPIRSGIPGWEALMQYEIARAKSYFASGLRVTEQIPRRAGVCVFTMAGIYTAILERLTDDPYLPLAQRASLSTRGKVAIMLRSWLQVV